MLFGGKTRRLFQHDKSCPSGQLRLSKKPRRVRCVSSEKNPNHFLPGRTPGWLLLPLRGNSPPVPGRKYISGCKCGASRSESNGTIASGNCSIMYGICSPMANKLCAQQTAKTGGKARRGFSTSSGTPRGASFVISVPAARRAWQGRPRWFPGSAG